jgi:hypothetical protein
MRAARQTSRRDASTRSAISASRKLTALVLGDRLAELHALARVVRCVLECRPASPVADAPSVTRERSKVSISPRKPWPSSPSRRSAGTRTLVEEKRTKAVMPRCRCRARPW